jgi:ABC-type multidrug transport system fused ATPase/permease subunit
MQIGASKLIIKRAWNIIDLKSQKKLIVITMVQVFSGLLDLLGVVVIGSLGALSIQGIASQAPSNSVGTLLNLFQLNELSFQRQVASLGLIAAFTLIVKTFMSVYFTRKTLYFLSREGAKVSGNLASQILSLDVSQLQKRSSQELLYIISDGVKNITIGILATVSTLLADFSLMLILVVGLFVLDPGVAIATILLFSVVGLTLHKILQVRAQELGVMANTLTVKSNQKILEVLGSYRESVVRNRRKFYSEEIRTLRYNLGEVVAETSFMPYISKYVIESTVVVSFLLLSAYQFGTKGAVEAVALLSVFFAASSRIAPAALRIQQNVLTLRNSLGSSFSTLTLISELKNEPIVNISETRIDFNHKGFSPDVKVQNLNYSYSHNGQFALRNIHFTIPSGTSLAIIGPSGSGKSTLVDLILGVLKPDSGSVLISNMAPNDASAKWSGAISYVPQAVLITDGTVRENVGLGYPLEYAKDERVDSALEFAQLSEFVRTLPKRIDSNVGEFGNLLSGGQRQRLGIARALFTNPKLLVLDEATSALDGQTEADLSAAIDALSGEVTLIIIAHRLSTIRNVDLVIYLDSGEIKATGTFDEVREKISEFDQEFKNLEH